MKVSIITVCFNSEKTIKDTLESIKIQDYKNIEYIIIDGKSSDNTLKITDKYRDIITHLCSEKDQGLFDAMNKGIDMATGDILGILNSDDFYIYPQVISDVVAKFQDSNVDSVYANQLVVDYFNTNKVIRFWKSGNYKRFNFNFGWMPPHPTFFVKKSVYDNFGKFNLKYNISADYDLMSRFLFKEKISSVYLDKTILKFRDGGNSSSNIRSRLKANREDYKSMKENEFNFPFLARILKPLRKIPHYFTVSTNI